MNELETIAHGTIMVGFQGTELSEQTRRLLRDAQFAGYILFPRNTGPLDGVRALTDDLRSLHSSVMPPVIAIDQEGGRVVRLREDVETIPPMMAVGATQDAGLARDAGEAMARDLRRAGFSLDFAPVADLALEPMNTVIGTRAFGADPDLVVRLAAAFAEGLRSGGVIPTFKHFPGHGSTAVDSHLALPAVDLDEGTLRDRDLCVFAALLPDAQAVMTAHIVMRAFDPEHPATLSHRILTGILRDDWGFGGVCFTDCLQMEAIARGIGSVPGALAAIGAGADCLLISHDPDLALEAAAALVRAVEGGELERERLEQAYRRVSRLRATLSEPLPIGDASPHPGIGRRIARRAVTALRGQPHADPAASVVVSFEGATVEGVQGAHRDHPSLRREAPSLAEIFAPLEPDETQRTRVLDEIARSGRRPIVLSRRAHVYPTQAAAIESVLAQAPDALVVSMREPFDLPLFERARHLLAIYGDDAACVGGLADVIFGAGDAAGTLPVHLERR